MVFPEREGAPADGTNWSASPTGRGELFGGPSSRRRADACGGRRRRQRCSGEPRARGTAATRGVTAPVRGDFARAEGGSALQSLRGRAVGGGIVHGGHQIGHLVVRLFEQPE